MEKKSSFLIKAIVITLFFTVEAHAACASQKTKMKRHAKKPQSACENCSGLPTFSGTFDITSNYMSEGISNSNNSPAVQGGLTATFIKGFYVNVWGSNVSLIDDDGKIATLELDTSAGITNNIGKNVNYNFYLVRYNYPDSRGLAYNEVVGSLGYGWLTGLIEYSANAYDSGKSGTYYNLGVKYPLPIQSGIWHNTDLSGGVGYYDLPKSAGLLNYADYNLGISKTIGIYNLALQWTDTNHQSVGAENLQDSKIVGTVTVSF